MTTGAAVGGIVAVGCAAVALGVAVLGNGVGVSSGVAVAGTGEGGGVVAAGLVVQPVANPMTINPTSNF